MLFAPGATGRQAGARHRPHRAELDHAKRLSTAPDAFLQEHGRRSTLYITVSTPSYIEDPSPLIVALQDAITQPARDDAAALAAAARERELLIASARERIASLPAPVKEQFEFLLSEDPDDCLTLSNQFAVRAELAAGKGLPRRIATAVIMCRPRVQPADRIGRLDYRKR